MSWSIQSYRGPIGGLEVATFPDRDSLNERSLGQVEAVESAIRELVHELVPAGSAAEQWVSIGGGGHAQDERGPGDTVSVHISLIEPDAGVPAHTNTTAAGGT